MKAMMPSVIMAPPKTGRPSFSVFRQRAIRGDWVAWKPLTAPQAIVMNMTGNSGKYAGWRLWKRSMSGSTSMRGMCIQYGRDSAKGISSITPRMPATMIISATEKRGYTRPMMAWMGRMVARK